MKVRISRFFVVAVITGMSLAAGSTTAWAQSPNYSPDFSTNQNLMTLNGNTNGVPQFVSPAEGPTVLRLTPNVGNRVAAAWFNVQQPVQNGFTTTFTFQLTNPSTPPADGIAFVIQNDSRKTGAIGFIGGNGGALGYGDRDNNVDPSQGEGIANSLAIEFDTYQNGWDLQNANHIAIQSCGTGPNTSHHNVTCGGNGPSTSTLGFFPINTPIFSAGVSHTVKITYTPPSGDSSEGTLQVTLDNNDPVSVQVNLATLLALGSSGNAYVGFTAATGGSFETQDIGSWTYQAQVPPGETTVFNFPNNNYALTPDPGQNATAINVTPILMGQDDCTALVRANADKFVDGSSGLSAKCFNYSMPDGVHDSSVMYEVTCPDLGTDCSPFFADLSSTFDLAASGNPGFNPTNPFPGWLKGYGGVPGHACAEAAGGFPNGHLFNSNQISFFDQDVSDPVTKGRSGGTASCWVATYNTPHEAPTVTITTPANGHNYQLGVPVNSAFECKAVTSMDPSVGPYLTVPTIPAPGGCTGIVDSGSPMVSGSPIDTSTPGPHTFIAKVTDSATDTTTSDPVTYNVVTPADLAILKVAPLLVRAGGTITYTIGVGNLGGSNAVDVVVSDILPANTHLLSASGKNVSCSVVNRRLTCSTTPITCTGTSAVSCSASAIAPLSWSSLNGATLKITVQLLDAWTAGTTVKNTATVSGSNADPKPNNNSSTASTRVTR